MSASVQMGSVREFNLVKFKIMHSRAFLYIFKRTIQNYFGFKTENSVQSRVRMSNPCQVDKIQ